MVRWSPTPSLWCPRTEHGGVMDGSFSDLLPGSLGDAWHGLDAVPAVATGVTGTAPPQAIGASDPHMGILEGPYGVPP